VQLVLEKQQILISKTFKFEVGVLRRTIAQRQQKSREFILPLAVNTLLGFNKLKHSLPIAKIMFIDYEFEINARQLAHNQVRQSKLFL
jgi:hypothetical protein